MNATLKQKVSEVLSKYKFSKEDAQFIADVLGEIDDRQRTEFEAKMDNLLNQKDKTELITLMKSDKTELVTLMQKDKLELIDRIQTVQTSLLKHIYIVGLIQFLAIVGSVIGIINFMIK